MFCAITSHVHRIQFSTNNKTQKVSRCLLSTEARWRRLPLLSSVTRLGKRWRKQKADSLLCQVRRQGGAASDECKIDIHSQASLQPRDALIWVFIESFICRAKQLCRPREHTHRKPPKKHFYRQSFFYLASVSSDYDDFILYSTLPPFQTYNKGWLYNVSCCSCSSDRWRKIFDISYPLGLATSLKLEFQYSTPLPITAPMFSIGFSF